MNQEAYGQQKLHNSDQNFMLRLREALEASWDRQTAYRAVGQVGNRSLGQCYPTSRVLQHYFPETQIIKGFVWTGKNEEVHFWNGLQVDDIWFYVDLTWQQFPTGSIVREFVVLDRSDLSDSEATTRRCSILLKRVQSYLSKTTKKF
jgi:hypothetical protein